MKFVKFMAYWAVHAAFFYAWLELGYDGAFNVVATGVVVLTLIFLLSLGMSKDRVAEIASEKKQWYSPAGVVLRLGEITILIWTGHVWLGVPYFVSWGICELRIQAAREDAARA
ncbi:hypothetical protein [Paraburkholderia sp. 2C]